MNEPTRGGCTLHYVRIRPYAVVAVLLLVRYSQQSQVPALMRNQALQALAENLQEQLFAPQKMQGGHPISHLIREKGWQLAFYIREHGGRERMMVRMGGKLQTQRVWDKEVCAILEPVKEGVEGLGLPPDFMTFNYSTAEGTTLVG